MTKEKNSFKLIIATPFYEVKGYSPYISSLINCTKALSMADIEWEYMEHSGDSYVDRAKNAIVSRFLKSDGTHLFMIDSDLQWDVRGFLKLIKWAKYGLNVVGGTFPNKHNWNSYGTLPLYIDGSYSGIEKGDMRCLEVRFLPGGFLIYSREAFEVTKSSVKEYFEVGIKDKSEIVSYHEFFRCDIAESGGRMGEDVYFQNKFRQAGGKVFLEPDITFNHWGCKGWQGNYNDHLLGREIKNAELRSQKIVQEAELCHS